uniref:Uncharacterized protein n=1 Tax=Chryseobacterium endophyticum TaxID=1854762 RepID=A0AAU6WM95_9FLAO
MAVYILSNRKIVRHKGEKTDSFSNDEYSIPNFRIAKCDFENYIEPTKAAQNNKDYTNRNILNYTLFSEPEKQGYEEVLDVLLKEKGIRESPLTADNLGGTQRMFYELYKNMSSTKDRSDVMIFIHGYAYDFDDELKAIIDLKKSLSIIRYHLSNIFCLSVGRPRAVLFRLPILMIKPRVSTQELLWYGFSTFTPSS